MLLLLLLLLLHLRLALASRSVTLIPAFVFGQLAPTKEGCVLLVGGRKCTALALSLNPSVFPESLVETGLAVVISENCLIVNCRAPKTL